MRYLFGLLSLFLSSLALAGPFTPTKEPVAPDGVKATVDLPPSEHVRNIGGRDGLGLCVFTSYQMAANGWHNLSDFAGFQAWMHTQPGGGYPEKLDAMVKKYCQLKGIPVPLYVQHTGGDEAFLEQCMKTRRIICMTYAGRDDFYRSGIDHMVNGAHLDGKWGMIIDNNRPGTYLWMSRADFLQRWKARGGGWAVAFIEPGPVPYKTDSPTNREGCRCGEKCKGNPCNCVPTPDSCKCYPCKCCEKKSDQCPCDDPCPCVRTVFGQCGPGGCNVRPAVPDFVVPPPAPVVIQPTTDPTVNHELGLRLAKESGKTLVTWIGVFPDRRVAGTITAYETTFGNHPAGTVLVTDSYGTRTLRSSEVNPTTVAQQVFFGVEKEKIDPSKFRYWVSGEEVPREVALQLVNGPLPDDSNKWYLSAAVATPSDKENLTKKILQDSRCTPHLARVHLNVYLSSSWVARARGITGVQLLSPVSQGKKLVWSAPSAGVDEIAEALSRTDPNWQPPKPPTPAPSPNPTPSPEPNKPTNNRNLYILGGLLGLGALLVLNRSKK